MAKELSMRKIHEILRLHYEHGLSSRQGTGATLITSQYAPSHWHEIIGDATVADAILDRLTHNAHRIELKGDSLRKLKDKGAMPSRSETKCMVGWHSQQSCSCRYIRFHKWEG